MTEARIKYTVIAVELATQEDKVRLNYTRNSNTPLYKARIQAESRQKLEDCFPFATMHSALIVREHPQIGETYTLSFSKDE